MDPNDPVCYKCGKAGYKEYGYFLVQRLPDTTGKFSFKSLLFPGGALTLGNYYTMVICDRCLKKEYINRVLLMMSAISGILAVLFAIAMIVSAGPGSLVFPYAVLAALILSNAVCVILIIIKPRKALSVTEGENCAVRLYNRDHHYSKDGVSAMAPGKARAKFNI